GSGSPAANGASDTGADTSRLAVTGDLNFQPSAVDVVGLTGADGTFNPAQYYSWTVATGTTGHAIAAQPTFNTTGLTTGGGSFTLSSSGGSVFVSFTPAPEPATILLGCAVAAGVTGYVRRQRDRRQVTS